MAGFRIEGNTSGNVAEVTAANEIRTTGGSATIAGGGYNVSLFENSLGTYTGGVPYRESPLVTGDGRLSVGMDTPLFDYTFNGTISNSSVWKTAFTTQTVAASGGFLQLNANSTATTTTYCAYSTWKHFSMRGGSSLHVNWTWQSSLNIPANQISEAGLFIPVANAIPGDGVFVRWTSAGLYGVTIFNGVETATSVFTYAPTAGVNYQLAMNVYENEVEFWVQVQGAGAALLGELTVPNANGQPFLTSGLPLAFVNRNSGTVTSPAVIKISDAHIDMRDANHNKPYQHQLAAMGAMISQLPDGSAIPTTGAKTTIWANNTAPTAVAMTNTTAAFTGLGGIAAVLPTLAAASDGVLFSYQNPVGTVNQTPRTLYITGLTLQGAVSVILTGGPVTYAYALAYGHTAVSLATAETATFATATTKAPRIVPIGMDNFIVTAPAGTLGGQQQLILNTPIAINPGEFVQIIARNIGTVTTLGAVTFVASFDGYWE